ncbi:hypothetical protein F4780DRAFT_770489 [Xylariomycetidae sp. FL0641]|nr:hypothetical protein F4780DRAFT_770489 [Xylariomycetidae sp. FL0641]
MPHRVVDFFRSSNDQIHNIKASVSRKTSPTSSRRSSTSRASRSRERPVRPVRNSSYASSVEDNSEDHPVAMPEAAPREKHHHHLHFHHKEKDHKEHHRLSFPLAGLHLGGSKAHKDQSQHPHASLDWKIESPPAVMHGNTEESTGALVSGQLLLCVKEEPFEVESFDAKLMIHVTQKRPFSSHCQNCTNQKTELKKWSFLTEPTALTKRTHEFPFSVLLDGHLPATTDNSIVSINYDFVAEVKPRAGPTLRLQKNIPVRRSLPVPDMPHHSVRIFPPTNITASVVYDQVVHPIGANQFSLRLDGIVKHNPEAKSVEFWKLKRLSWKLEENLTTIAPACEKHAPRSSSSNSNSSSDAAAGAGTAAAAAAAGTEHACSSSRKGAKRTDSRTIAHADMHGGWKSDYAPGAGSIETEITYRCGPGARASCDVRAADGTEVSHQLVVEMVVVQEYCPAAQPRHVTPTGVARILRMHFGVTLTERAGLGVSWDNEAPPIYQDVPPSPPAYFPAHIVLNGRSHPDHRSRGQSPAYEEERSSRGQSPAYAVAAAERASASSSSSAAAASSSS